MTKTNDHLIWLEAHYALGRLEIAQGFQLDWRARREFLLAKIAELHAENEEPINHNR